MWKIFRDIAGDHPVARKAVQRLAQTAHAIDPECPHGAFGVLSSIRDYKLKPAEFAALYERCGSNPLVMNAVDFAVFKGIINVDAVRNARHTGFRALNVPQILRDVKAIYPEFGRNYTRSFAP